MPSSRPTVLAAELMVFSRGVWRLRLEVDGGVDPETAKVCVAAGANVLVAGSSVYKAENIPERIAQLRG